MRNRPPYSVLLSVYKNDDPDYLRIALDSMFNQTVPPDEVVLVKDGLLTDKIEKVLAEFDSLHPHIFNYVAYPENHGLGYALRKGVIACTNEVIARMDADDYAFPTRMELQLDAMVDGELDMVSSQVVEFVESPYRPIAETNLPERYEEIIPFSKRRNPFRHSPMTFRKSKVLEAGNYSVGFLYFEDWDLFNRMLAIGCRAENLHEPLVAVRVSKDFYGRRGGTAYLRHAWRFKAAQVKNGYFTKRDFLFSFVPQAVVCLLPNSVRGLVYSKLLRRAAS